MRPMNSVELAAMHLADRERAEKAEARVAELETALRDMLVCHDGYHCDSCDDRDTGGYLDDSAYEAPENRPEERDCDCGDVGRRLAAKAVLERKAPTASVSEACHRCNGCGWITEETITGERETVDCPACQKISKGGTNMRAAGESPARVEEQSALPGTSSDDQNHEGGGVEETCGTTRPVDDGQPSGAGIGARNAPGSTSQRPAEPSSRCDDCLMTGGKHILMCKHAAEAPDIGGGPRTNEPKPGLPERMHGRLEYMAADARYRAQRALEEETADIEAAEDRADELEHEAAVIERCANALVEMLRKEHRPETPVVSMIPRHEVLEMIDERIRQCTKEIERGHQDDDWLDGVRQVAVDMGYLADEIQERWPVETGSTER